MLILLFKKRAVIDTSPSVTVVFIPLAFTHHHMVTIQTLAGETITLFVFY